MEEVAHGVHEHHAGRSPPVGELQQVFVQCEAEAGAAVLGVAVVLIPGIAHGLQALRQGERVAVVAAVRGAVAAGAGVPSCLGPLDAGPVGHGHLPSSPSYPQGTHQSAGYGPGTTGLSLRDVFGFWGWSARRLRQREPRLGLGFRLGRIGGLRLSRWLGRLGVGGCRCLRGFRRGARRGRG